MDNVGTSLTENVFNIYKDMVHIRLAQKNGHSTHFDTIWFNFEKRENFLQFLFG